MTETPVPAAPILLVDDRRENLLALEAVLEPLGAPMLRANSGEEALRQLLLHDVALMVLDVAMPGMDGYETAARIKARERTRDVPIIFLTAQTTDSSDALQGFSTGAVDYVMKPFDPVLLRAKVNVFVDLHRKTQLLKRHSQILTARLDQHFEDEARLLRRLSDAALAINSTLALADMLKVINESAREVIGADQAETVLAQGDETGTERWRCYSSKDRWSAEEGRHVDMSPVYKVVREGEAPVHMTDEAIDNSLRWRDRSDAASGHSSRKGGLAVPLVGRAGRRLGVLQVADKLEGDFTDLDEVVLVQLAQLAAVAIENGERYEQEHRIAESLQWGLLPPALPDVPGLELAATYRPAGSGAQVGGDWYDVFVLPDDRVALAIGDVAGRGPRAAAVMGQLRTAMRAYGLQGLPPGDVMASLDRLAQELGGFVFATATYLVVDASSGAVVMANAGHPPPLIVAPGEHARYLQVDPNLPLGVASDPHYSSTTTRLEPGTLVLLYTDGLIEGPGRPLTEGMAALADAASAAVGDVASISTTVMSDMALDDDHDDVALVAVRLTVPQPAALS